MPRAYGITNAAPYASAPAVGAAGDTYWNSTDKVLYVSDGTAWQVANPDASKLTTGTIAQARLPVAPSGLATANLNDLAVTSAKIAVGATVYQQTSVAGPTSFTLGAINTWIKVCITPALTTRGGLVAILVSISLSSLFSGVARSCYLQVRRDDVTALLTTLYASNANHGLPAQVCLDTACPAGSHTWALWAQIDGGQLTTPGSNTGTMWVVELA